VIGDLTDRRPQTVEHKPWKELEEEIVQRLKELSWIKDVEVRLREHGHFVMGETFVLPSHVPHGEREFQEAARLLTDIDWRLHDIVLTLVPPDQMAASSAHVKE
jgi:hypothetical protein